MRRPLVATLATVCALLLSCGGGATRPSPTTTGPVGPTSTATASASATPQPTATSSTPTIRAGAYAYIAVTLATGWRNPSVFRAVDAPALANPVRISDWLNNMNWSQKAGLIGRADTQVLLGDRVLVLAVAGNWAQVVVPDQPTPLDSRGYPAWIPTVQLSAVAPPTTASVATVTAPSAWLRASSGATTVELSFGTRLPIMADRSSLLQVGLPAGITAEVDRADVTVGTLPPTATAVLDSAHQFLGLQYLWAGTSAFGYDCSGLVYLVYRSHGVRLPRDADAQATAGRWVAKASLQPADLVFFGTSAANIHHVAIYAGNGNILESPQTGSPVRVIPLSTYADYVTGRRVLP